MKTPEQMQAMLVLAFVAGHLLMIGLGTYLSNRWWGKEGRKKYLIYALVNFFIYVGIGLGVNPLLLLLPVKLIHFRKKRNK